MNVSTIIISPETALAKLNQYEKVQSALRTREDEALLSLYKSVSKGARCINVAEAFKQTGLNERGEPRLAIARATWPDVWCHNEWGDRISFQKQRGWPHSQHSRTFYRLPNGLLGKITFDHLKTAVPHIPPDIRPAKRLDDYFILFEVKEWQVYNVDPFLLRRVAGHLFIVEAEWELTELEAALLGAMR